MDGVLLDPAPRAHETSAALAAARARIVDGLTPQQIEAVDAVRGPVAILAGAGTGKTTTVTRRIAWQVASGTFDARDVLAVTFTDKAAGELRHRLAALGVRGVEARTFHGAARWMLGVLWTQYTGAALPELMPHKIVLLEEIVRNLPMPDCFRPRRELAQEIEWAKNRRITPETYLDELARTGHEQPLKDPRRMQSVYERYERAKAAADVWDFEDLLLHLAQLLVEHPAAAARLRERFRTITVDEYQDVNPLQHALLEHWCGDAHDVCVVGDDYQTIYAFTGASPSWLLEFPERHAGATVVRLETSFRSTPAVLELANRLTPQLGGFTKVLRAAPGVDGAVVEDGAPDPDLRGHETRDAEVAWIAQRCRALHDDHGVAWHDMAVLYRINARSPELEAAFTAAGVPFVVTSGAFLERPGARGVLRILARRTSGMNVADVVRHAAERVGWRADGAVSSSDDAQTLQEDLTRLIAFAATGEHATVGEWLEAVRAHYGVAPDARGVELMTMHRAKGLEWEAVFLPRLNDRELPFRSRTSAAPVDDERRLLYVAITRAKRWLHLSWAGDAGAPSPLLTELGVDGGRAATARSTGSRGRSGRIPLNEDDPAVRALRAWRSTAAKAAGKPAYVIFDNRTLTAIAQANPSTLAQLNAVSGVGPAKLERHGDAVLAVLREVSAGDG